MVDKENCRLVSVDVNKGAGTITIVKSFQNIDYNNSTYPKVSPLIIRTEVWGVVDGRLDMISSLESRETFTTSHIVDTSL